VSALLAVRNSPYIRALDRAYDGGRDRAMADIAMLIIAMHQDGHDDSRIVELIEETVRLRMVVGLPVDEMFGGDAGH
jgi:hypothetical protein